MREGQSERRAAPARPPNKGAAAKAGRAGWPQPAAAALEQIQKYYGRERSQRGKAATKMKLSSRACRGISSFIPSRFRRIPPRHPMSGLDKLGMTTILFVEKTQFLKQAIQESHKAVHSLRLLLLCGHNFVNLTLLCYALNLPLDRLRELRQEPAALNVLYKRGERLRVELVNERSHLERYKERRSE